MTPALDQLAPEAGLFVLETARVGGVIAAAPVPWTNAPARVRAGLTIFVAALVHGHTSTAQASVDSPGAIALALGSETLLGVALGLVVRLVISSVEIAGNAITLPMGFGAAQAFDPTTGSADSVLTRLFRQLALLIAVTSGFHRQMLSALLASYRWLPVGGVPRLELSFPVLLDLSANALAVGVRLALPLLAVLLIANVSLGFVSRAAPAMQIFSVGFAVLLATGAAVLVLSLPALAIEIGHEMERGSEALLRLLVSTGGG